MSIRSFIILFCTGLCYAASLNAQSSSKKTGNTIEKAAWLLGTWEQTTSKGIVYETWTHGNDGTFNGKSYLLKASDTVVLETIKLVQQQEGLFYIPTVSNQNNRQPVSFKCSKITVTEMVFHNPVHDFPQKITYRKTGKNSLIATISGTQNGQMKSRDFVMKRKE